MNDLRQLAEAATRWSLKVQPRTNAYFDVVRAVDRGHESKYATAYTEANAAYIAACSPERILKLLDELDEARALLAQRTHPT